MSNDEPKPKIEFDAVVEKVVPDPSKPVDSVVLRGFVGRSTEEGSIRLYLSRDLSDYVEIQAADVIHSQQLSSAQSPAAGSVVYVKPDARLRRVQVSAQTEARFLQGQLVSAFAGSTEGPSSGAGLAEYVAGPALIRASLVCRTTPAWSCMPKGLHCP